MTLEPPAVTDQRVATMLGWLDELDVELSRLEVERAVLRHAIETLDHGGTALASRALTTTGNTSASMVITSFPPKAIEASSSEAPPALASRRQADAARKKAARERRRTGTPATKQANPPGQSKYDYAEVARIAVAAQRNGAPMARSVADAFGTTEGMGGQLIIEARKRGLDIPKLSQGGRKPAAAPNVTEISTARSAPPKRRGPVIDYPEIARHIIELQTAGKPLQQGIMGLYKVPMSTARQWIRSCREQGLVKPVDANLRVVEDNTIDNSNAGEYVAELVANSYREALRENRRPVQYVADSLNVDKATAIEWVRRARADGALPPAAEPQLPEEERRALLDIPKPEPVA